MSIALQFPPLVRIIASMAGVILLVINQDGEWLFDLQSALKVRPTALRLDAVLLLQGVC